MDIKELREKINQIDDVLTDAFKRRMEVALEIAKYKQEKGLPVYDPQREQAVIARLTEGCDETIADSMKTLYNTLFALSREYQQRYMRKAEARFGLIGHPLSHSCSPRVHQLLGGEGYQLWDVAPEELEAFLRERAFDGINVTIPHKQAVMPFCDALSDTARRIGSVNTIVKRKDGTLFGDNTDAYGFECMAQRAGIDFKGKKVLVLGSGGTSHTACAVIGAAGGQTVVISRSGENHYENLHLHTDADVIVNTTPVGMYPQVDEQIVDLAAFPRLTGVLDVIYNPLRTRLLQQAEKLHIPCGGGLYMLCAQAARARELFTGEKISETVLEKAYQTLLHERQSIVLIGMPGCGKTTIAQALSEKLQLPMVDTDAEIVRRAGRSIPEIFAQDGEKAFRELEASVIADVCATGGCILSTGGGAVLKEENRRHLRMNARVIWLQRDLDKLPCDGRPLSKNHDAIEQMYALRAPLYADCADVMVKNEDTVEHAIHGVLHSDL